MKWNDMHNFLIAALEKKIPEKAKLADVLSDILCMEKGAVYRRIRGEVPFSFFEIVNITEKLNMSLDSLVHANSMRTDRFVLKLIEYTELNDIDYTHWDDYNELIDSAKNDSKSEIAESLNVLPISIYSKFDTLSRYYLFKWQYLFNGTKSRLPYRDLVIPERLYRIYQTYFEKTRNIANTLYVWDHLIFQYLVTDIKYFSSINLVTSNDIRQIKEELFAFLDYTEKIAINGCFEETGKPVQFYISDINLEADYSYIRINDLYISLVRTFILYSGASLDRDSYEKTKAWIQSLKKSSTLVTQSGTMLRAHFFEKQRNIISEL
ncbi:MAG: hypothetical protein LBL33_04745 [Tannerella sp.]|jgi:hypothetical protein|nr:hypothetical protein [Tannerella sp.]